MAGYFGSLASAARSRYANLRLNSFTDANSDNDHPDNEDESAVSRALRNYYQEKEGFVPDWLTPAITHPSTVPNRLASGASQASQKTNVSLSDIWDAPPGGQQQQAPLPQQPRQNSPAPARN